MSRIYSFDDPEAGNNAPAVNTATPMVADVSPFRPSHEDTGSFVDIHDDDGQPQQQQQQGRCSNLSYKTVAALCIGMFLVIAGLAVGVAIPIRNEHQKRETAELRAQNAVVSGVSSGGNPAAGGGGEPPFDLGEDRDADASSTAADKDLTFEVVTLVPTTTLAPETTTTIVVTTTEPISTTTASMAATTTPPTAAAEVEGLVVDNSTGAQIYTGGARPLNLDGTEGQEENDGDGKDDGKQALSSSLSTGSTNGTAPTHSSVEEQVVESVGNTTMSDSNLEPTGDMSPLANGSIVNLEGTEEEGPFDAVPRTGQVPIGEGGDSAMYEEPLVVNGTADNATVPNTDNGNGTTTPNTGATSMAMEDVAGTQGMGNDQQDEVMSTVDEDALSSSSSPSSLPPIINVSSSAIVNPLPTPQVATNVSVPMGANTNGSTSPAIIVGEDDEKVFETFAVVDGDEDLDVDGEAINVTIAVETEEEGSVIGEGPQAEEIDNATTAIAGETIVVDDNVTTTNLVLEEDAEEQGGEDIATSNNGDDEDPEDQEPLKVSRLNLPNRFNAKLRPFRPEIMTVEYQSCSDLVEDIETALKVLADMTIDQQKESECYNNYLFRRQPFMKVANVGLESSAAFDAPQPNPAPPVAADGARTSSGASAAKDVTEDSFGTNNQVEGVDEADTVKADGEYLFTAYGSEVIMIRVEDGETVDRITVEYEDEEDGYNAEEDGEEIQEGEDSVPIDGDVSTKMFKSLIAPFPMSNQKRTVKSLLLDKETKRLTVITHLPEDYGYDYGLPLTRGGGVGAPSSSTNEKKKERVVGGGSTSAIVLDYSNAEKEGLVDVGTLDIPGNYHAGRSIGGTAHVLTHSNLKTYPFTNQLSRCSEDFKELDDDEYEQRAYVLAQRKISEYAEQIVEELQIDGSSSSGCSHIAQISSMADEGGKDYDEVKTSRRLDLTNGRGLLDTFMQITSFNVEEATPNRRLQADKVGVAGAFLPTSNMETYANKDYIILAARGYRRIPDAKYYSYSEYTFLMSFQIVNGGAKVKKRGVGEVQGYLLNQFSMDEYDSVLRVATTTRQRWGIIEQGDGTNNWGLVMNSTSQVTKLAFSSDLSGEMVELGQLNDLGVTEEIQSCRFIKDRAYVVTFRRTDPLYVINMTPKVPEVLGELKITGFSSYMHPIENEPGLLLGVGQEADEETGRTTGFKVSLFDVSDPLNPKERHKYVIDKKENGYSSSQAQWDQYAFRYLEESQLLILPMSIYNWNDEKRENFDGFMIYDVIYDRGEEGGIFPFGNVTHANYETINESKKRGWCFRQATLPARSMVFGGRLVTFKGHFIRMTESFDDLDDVTWLADLDADLNPDEDDCYGYFPWI